MDELKALRDRLDRLEALHLADSLAIRALVTEIYSDTRLRAQRREELCASIEALYGQHLASGGHDRLQRALAEVEGLFQV